MSKSLWPYHLTLLATFWLGACVEPLSSTPEVLGGPESSGQQTVEPDVRGQVDWSQVDAGMMSSCALTTVGKAYCWGLTSDTGCTTSACAVAARPRAVNTSLVEDHACGVTVNHNIYCWGLQLGGGLGNGVTQPGVRIVPTRVLPPE